MEHVWGSVGLQVASFKLLILERKGTFWGVGWLIRLIGIKDFVGKSQFSKIISNRPCLWWAFLFDFFWLSTYIFLFGLYIYIYTPTVVHLNRRRSTWPFRTKIWHLSSSRGCHPGCLPREGRGNPFNAWSLNGLRSWRNPWPPEKKWRVFQSFVFFSGWLLDKYGCFRKWWYPHVTPQNDHF